MIEASVKRPWVRAIALLAAAAVAAGCTLRAVREAPIEDKSASPRTSRPAPIATAPAPAAAPAPPAPAAVGPREAANGTYVVQRGDTLYSIAIAFGHDYRDIARWNNLEDPTRISVGQTLRVAPPEGDTPAAAVVGVVTVTPSAGTETRPLDAAPVPAAPQGSPLPANPASPPPTTVPASPPATVPAPSAPPSPAPMPPPAPEAKAAPPPAAGLLWQWPAKGKVVEAFAEGRNKGIDIGGSEGDAVLAAGDGEVVYSGSGLRTYGNLVIIKHSEDYISAYGHNKQILVKQGDSVRRGQRIASVGKSDDGLAKLHFEIRYKGKPVDPARLLPPAR